ncbi:prenyltransferase [Leptospira sp. WS60.C2]
MFQRNKKEGTNWILSLISFGSIDIVVSVWGNLSFFSFYFQNRLSSSLVLFYLVSVWTLYQLDHLWDAKKESTPLSIRANFYVQNQIWIVAAMILSLAFSCYLGMTKEWDFLQSNQTYLVFFVFTIFLVVKQISPIPKEILVSFFYTWGIFLPFSHGNDVWEIRLIFFLHVLANVLLTYQMDRDRDEKQNTFTLNRILSALWMQRLVQTLFFLGVLLLVWSSIQGFLPMDFGLGMGFSYLWLFVASRYTKNPIERKVFLELSYLPMFLPEIIFFFSGLR